MSTPLAAIVGGVGGVLAVVGVVIFCVVYCTLQRNNSRYRNSDTGSSEQSAVVELKRGGGGGPSSSTVSDKAGPHEAIQFAMEELGQATKHFHESNLIGYGSFGLVYKGLLSDGTVVAIKRRTGAPREEFVEEVTYLSRICHRNLVTLLGYCQEYGYQMLVFEHLPNGSMCSHLYDNAAKNLEFKQRISISHGAAKGLCHLHTQQPSFVHGNFKTANVLVDENFIAKVADAGVSKLLQRIEEAGPSTAENSNFFRDPEADQVEMVTKMNDVYSFGVFLLELVTGQEASRIDSFSSNESILQWVETHLNSNDFVDQRLVGSFTTEGMKDFIRLTLQCMSFPGKRRPTMEMVVEELDRILEKEVNLTTVTGEGPATITLGSQLFT